MASFEPVLTKVMKGETEVMENVWKDIIKFDSATKKLKFAKYGGASVSDFNGLSLMF